MPNNPTAYEHVLASMQAGKFGSLWIEEFLGSYYLVDDEYRRLDSSSYPTRAAAEHARTKIRERASKAFWRKSAKISIAA